MRLSPGTRLGTYEIVGPLGAGGMGEVYRARDTRLRREVAVKVLPATSSPDQLARFEREARTIAGLNHPNIVTLFSVEDEDGIRFLTMELVEGQTLARLLTPNGLPIPQILDLSIPIADALVAAHERGVVHRDLKPGNVMVTREGRVKVLDFGLAKVLPHEGPASAGASTVTAEVSITAEGRVMGTMPYMAPEQVRGEVVDARTDLFALGVILHELASGRRPFTGATPADIGASILRDTPTSLGSVRSDLPADLDRIVARCLEKAPRDRTQTALDVFNELRRLKQSLAGGSFASPRPARPVQGVPSIAVLPFVNRSRDEEDEYFSDGLADELLNTLSKIRGLRVAARTSSFQFRGRNEDVSMIGQKLNVATLLEASIRKAGNRVRVWVRLVKVSDGYHLWSETYDRTLEDIFAVQDDIARSVVKELRTTLLGEEADSKTGRQAKAEVAKAAKGRATDPEAHRLYLQGRYFLDRHTREDTARGIGYLNEALELEPECALAWAELGRAFGVEAGNGWVPPAEGYARYRNAAERALTLEPDLVEGHMGLAWIQMVCDYDWKGAEESYAHASQLAPGNAAVLRGIATLNRNLGRFEDAIELVRRAVEQDPLSAAAYNNLGFAYHAAGYLVEAEKACLKALELAPQRVGTRSFLAMAFLDQGRSEEALAEAMREPDEKYSLWALAIVHHVMGHMAQSDEALQRIIEKYAEHSACQVAEVHAVRGETDEAFEWLQRAYTQRGTGLAGMKSIPRFHSLHTDPRWATLLRKMGFGG